MADFTLFELHLHDADFTANAPFSSGSGDGSSGFLGRKSKQAAPETEESDEASSALPAVVGLAVAIAAVVVVRRLVRRRRGSESVVAG